MISNMTIKIRLNTLSYFTPFIASEYKLFILKNQIRFFTSDVLELTCSCN